MPRSSKHRAVGPAIQTGVRTIFGVLLGLSLFANVLFSHNAYAAKQSVADVVGAIGDAARQRLLPDFEQARVQYPPRQVTLLIAKDTASMELWAGPDTQPVFIRRYAIAALPEEPGPKLSDADMRLPEGIYNIDKFDPSSDWHLALRLSFPNEFDLANAADDGRSPPGATVFMHGSVPAEGRGRGRGIELGNDSIEELFLLASDTGKRSVKVVIAPTDPRLAPLEAPASPPWITTLYEHLATQFGKFPLQSQ